MRRVSLLLILGIILLIAVSTLIHQTTIFAQKSKLENQNPVVNASDSQPTDEK